MQQTPSRELATLLEWSKESLSELQQNDIANVLRISESSLNKDYLEKNAVRLGVDPYLKKIYETIGHKPKSARKI